MVSSAWKSKQMINRELKLETVNYYYYTKIKQEIERKMFESDPDIDIPNHYRPIQSLRTGRKVGIHAI